MARNYPALIAALLAKAASTEHSGEADAFRAKAEQLMSEYRIEESEALAEDPTVAEPEMVTVQVTVRNYELSHYLIDIARACAEHAEIKIRVKFEYLLEGYNVVITAVGYSGDLRYFELLWTNAHLMFATRITPTWSTARPDSENVYLMRQAGIKRREIADAAGWDGTNAAARSRVQRVYLAEAARRGEVAKATGLGFDSKGYRDAYAGQFCSTLRSEMRRARETAATGVPALFNRAERVAEAFYQFCPQMRPKATTSEPYVAPNVNCSSCHKAKSGFCRAHGYLKPRTWTRADEERWQRKQYGASAVAGRESGRDAARGVVVERGATDHGPAPRIERSNAAIEG